MNKMITKNQKLNTFSTITKHIWVCCSLAVLMLMSGSAWAQTAGESCDNPIVVSLPFSASGNTGDYGNNHNSSDKPANAPGAVTTGTGSSSYLNGNDVVFTYTPTADQMINVTTTNDNDWIGLWAFAGCPFSSTVGYHVATSGSARAINELPVSAGTTYYFVISTWPAPASTDFTINIEEAVADCPDLGLNIGSPCDDGDSNTINDVVNEDCECAGILPPDGMVCEAPIAIAALPYSTTDNTGNYGDNYENLNVPPLAEGAIGSPSLYYLSGDDVVYTYAPSEDGYIDVTVTEHGSWAGLYVFTGCPFESTVGGHTNSSATLDLKVHQLPVEAGVTYYIVVSTNAAPQSTPYTLSVVETVFDCPNIDANIGASCDDGDETTYDDTATEDCVCVGTPYDCIDLLANIGDACDDGDAQTVGDVVTESCTCEGTLPLAGTICEAPIAVSSLPYTTTDNTSNYGDDYSSGDRPAFAPGAVGNPSGSYLGGDDVVHAYTPDADAVINVSVTGQGTWTGLFVFTGCPFESTVGGATNGSPAVDLNVEQLPVSAGVTYYIVISTWPTPQSTAYTLSITEGELEFDCPDLGANIGDACDDDNPDTGNDTVNANCECVGEPIVIEDCLNTTSFGFANVNSPNTISISTCSWFGDYATIAGVVSGNEYEFTGVEEDTENPGYLTVRSGSPAGPVIGQGTSPLVVTATNSDDLYVHFNSDENCGSGFDCVITTATCVTCATMVDCEGVTGGSALPGTACDDNDPTTVNDQYNDDCECAGVPPAVGSICSSAIPVDCNSEPVTYSSAASNGSNTTSCSMGNNGLWFSFMGTGADITVNVSGSFDVEMSVNSGLCDALVNLACRDQYGSSGTETYTIQSSEDGAMYYVYVASWASGGTSTGDITIDIECASTEVDCPDLGVNIGDACDDGDDATINDVIGEDCVCAGVPPAVGSVCSSAIPVDCNSEPVTYSSAASNSSNTTSCSMGNNGLWFSFMGTGADITVNVSGSFDVEMSVNTNSCDTLVNLACRDQYGSSGTETYTIQSSEDGAMYYVYVASWASGGTSTGDITIDIDCAVAVDCPDLGLNIGDACDDEDDSTEGDVVGEDCVCAGTPIVVEYDCPSIEANIGDDCDDNNDSTENDLVTEDCECVGTPIAAECIADAGSLSFLDGTYNKTFIADDGIPSTFEFNFIPGNLSDSTAAIVTDINGFGVFMTRDISEGESFDFDLLGVGEWHLYVVSYDGGLSNGNHLIFDLFLNGIPVNISDLEGCFDITDPILVITGVNGPVYDCPEIEANFFDACDDGDDLTENDIVNVECECVGTPIAAPSCEDFVYYLSDHDAADGIADIYQVTLSGGVATMDLIATSDIEVHIAYNSVDNLIYAISKHENSYRTLDPSNGAWGSDVMLGGDYGELTAAVFNHDGKLLIGSQTHKAIYSVNVTTNVVSTYDTYAPVYGGDLAYRSDGMLYLATRSGNGLFEVWSEPAGDHLIGILPPRVTGMAITDADQLLISARGNNSLVVRNTDGTNPSVSYNLMLNGEPYTLRDGDMASGCNTSSGDLEGDCINYKLYYIHQPQGGGQQPLLEVTLNNDGTASYSTVLPNLGGHIGVSPDGNTVYAVVGNKLKVVDVPSSSVITTQTIRNSGGTALSGFPAAMVSQDGTLYAGRSNQVYTIDPVTAIATPYGPNRTVQGGDLIELDGEVWLITRANKTFTNVLTGDSFVVPVSQINGAAVLGNGNVLLADGNGGSLLKELDLSTLTVVATYDIGLPLHNGDLAGVCVEREESWQSGECYATEVVEFVQGTTKSGGVIPANRSDASKALGVPERVDALVFVALGYGGSITLAFDGAIPNGPGDDIEIVETSYGSPSCSAYPEFADVYVSVDGIDWHFAKTVCRTDGFVDISDAGNFDHVNFVKIANNNILSTTPDGFDVDGVVALHNCIDEVITPPVSPFEVIQSSSVLTSYPNPTQGPSKVVFTTGKTTHTLVEVYDMNGRNVGTLFNQEAQKGEEYTLDFNGSKLPNGVYVYRMTTNNETIIEKFMIAR